MKCQAINDAEEPCTNDARYIDEFGQFMCGICPIKYGADSLKFEDVGQLILWAREVLDGGMMGGSSFKALRAIMGTKPEPVLGPEPANEEVVDIEPKHSSFPPGLTLDEAEARYKAAIERGDW